MQVRHHLLVLCLTPGSKVTALRKTDDLECLLPVAEVAMVTDTAAAEQAGG